MIGTWRSRSIRRDVVRSLVKLLIIEVNAEKIGIENDCRRKEDFDEPFGSKSKR